jgi:hypothetical protein
MNHYYLDAQNHPAGPLPLEEIRRKAAAGEIPVNPMVAPVGSNRWAPLDGGTSAAAPLAPGQGWDRALPATVDTLLRSAAGVLSPGFLRASLDFAQRAGHIAVLVGLALGVLQIGYAAYVQGSVSIILGGLGLLAAVVVAHYAAHRMLPANDAMVARSRLASPALLDCAGALALAAILVGVIAAITALVRLGLNAWPIVVSSAIGVWLWSCFAAIALHPQAAQVEYAPGSAAEEGIDAVQFLLKCGLLLTPLAFGLTAVLADVAAAFALFNQLDTSQSLMHLTPFRLPRPLRPVGAGFAELSLLLTACLLPLIAHLAYVVASWPLGLWRSMIIMPAKLDGLKH